MSNNFFHWIRATAQSGNTVKFEPTIGIEPISAVYKTAILSLKLYRLYTLPLKDSNLWPPPYQSDALPNWAKRQFSFEFWVLSWATQNSKPKTQNPLVAGIGLEPMAFRLWAWHAAAALTRYILWVVLAGIEPTYSESKPDSLPLAYKTMSLQYKVLLFSKF